MKSIIIIEEKVLYSSYILANHIITVSTLLEKRFLEIQGLRREQYREIQAETCGTLIPRNRADSSYPSHANY